MLAVIFLNHCDLPLKACNLQEIGLVPLKTRFPLLEKHLAELSMVEIQQGL
jgi:hypothetical protein